MFLLDAAAWLIALPIATVSSVFSAEVLAGLRAPSVPEYGGGALPSTAILIPAHNEAAGVGAMLERLRGDLPAGMRVLLVADNCGDDTAAIARAHGAEVIERSDASLRGKGHALAFGRDHLAKAPPACVIVLDADCEISGADLALLARTAVVADRPVQANYLFHADRAAPPMVQVSNFALAVKNQLRQLGMTRIGAPAVLTGTGMAFPWRILADAPLATSNLVEDLELGIGLARAGDPPRFAPGATVWSAASSAGGTLTQRSRWEGGFVKTARRHALPLIASGVGRARGSLLWLGLHLATPPLALLLFLSLAALAAVLLLVLLGASPWPLALLALSGSGVAVALVGAWLKLGRRYLTGGALARLPLYALWKVPIYLGLARGGAKSWVRTERT